MYIYLYNNIVCCPPLTVYCKSVMEILYCKSIMGNNHFSYHWKNGRLTPSSHSIYVFKINKYIIIFINWFQWYAVIFNSEFLENRELVWFWFVCLSNWQINLFNKSLTMEIESGEKNCEEKAVIGNSEGVENKVKD